MKKTLRSTKSIVLLGMFIALCTIGGYIKLPNPVSSSIALDSFPAFTAALLLGGEPGAIVGVIGHLVSAAVGGFPLTLPIHVLIAAQMGIIMYLFRRIYKIWGLTAALVGGIVLNGIAAPLCFIIVPGYGLAFFIAYWFPLTAASIVNVTAACLVFKGIKDNKAVKSFLEE